MPAYIHTYVMPTVVLMAAYTVKEVYTASTSTKKQRKTNMKNKSKEYELLLLYDILAASDCLCSASHASAT